MVAASHTARTSDSPPRGITTSTYFVKFAERGDGGAIRCSDHLRRILGQPGAAQRFVEEPGQREVGMDGLPAAAQDHGVSGFQAKDGGVDGDVGARLENHGDDPERDAHLADHRARWGAATVAR